MSPKIALLLYILFILFLYKIDFKCKSMVSHSLWIPSLWMIIIGSRHVSQWLNLGTPIETSKDFLTGSPIDRNVYFLLIIAGLFSLIIKKISWSQIFKRNVWIFLLFLYSGISVLWSEFPFVSFKRWIKLSGNFVMILIVLTEYDPVESLKTMISRCAYVLIPLSILFIKYFPHIGRTYDPWTGAQAFCGVTDSKNMLGNLCLVCGLFFFWNILTIWRKKNSYLDKKEFFINVLFLLMILWLFLKINSITSSTCLVIGISVIFGLGFSLAKRNIKQITIYFFLIIILFLVLDLLFDLKYIFLSSVGRDMTLTGRTELWKEVINMDINPLIGTGYYSFWLGNRLEKLWSKFWWRPNQAHNGYLEIYLNLGLIGLFLLIGVIVSTYNKILKNLFYNFDYGRFQLAILIMSLVYNFTEAAFRGLHIIWFIFLLISMDVPHIKCNLKIH